MRWLGQMQRAFELMCSYSLERKAFGEPLAEKQTIQNWIAESAADIQACRLMTLQAAHRLDEGDEARVEVSLIKFFAAKVLQRGDRPRAAGARRARDDRRHAARVDVAAWRAARGSTTAPTRCTRWSSRGGSSARSRTAAPGASRSCRRRARAARAARGAARGRALGGRAGRARLDVDAHQRPREPRALPRVVRVRRPGLPPLLRRRRSSGTRAT